MLENKGMSVCVTKKKTGLNQGNQRARSERSKPEASGGNAQIQADDTYFRELAEAIPHIVWTAGPTGRIEYCNHRWCEYTGIPINETQDGRWLDVIRPDHATRVSDAWRKALTSGNLFEMEYPLRSKDGAYRWHLDRGVPVKDETGTIVKWFGTCTDVHEKREAEQMVLRMNEELERRVTERTSALKEINDQMEAFCYSVSHDLRAPLRAMRAFSQVLLDDYAPQLDANGHDYLNRVGRAAERMDRLIQDLLEYSRLGRIELTLAAIETERAVDSVLIDLRMEIRNKKAIVHVQKPIPRVIAHNTVLEQILSNLISNALKFVRKDVIPEITISTDVREKNLRISVYDNGIGIPPEYHHRIFNVFERLHGVESYPGTGIGLAIVQKGALRMNGRAGVQSALNEGSCFWIELPLA
jgi:PAS domain S-box-containing protein